jgi:phage shock protein A
MPKSSAPDPMEAVRRKVDDLKDNLKEIQEKAMLTSARDQAEDVETQANRVFDLARGVRERGYAWEKDLETKCLDFRKRWAALKPSVMQSITRETASLKPRVAKAETDVAQAVARAVNPLAAKAVLPRVEQSLDTLKGAAEAAENAILGMFDTMASDLGKLESHLKEISWVIDQAAAAKIEWLASESVVLAVKAKWDKDGKDDPKGVLYLTDQRLAFERKEDVATKKVLFIATEKEKVQEVLLIVPLSEMQEVTASKKGLMGHEDHLDFKFTTAAPARKAHFHIDGQDCNMWQATIGRVKDGEIEKSRVNPISEEEKKRLRGAPTKCSSCGGAIKAPILRGQTEIHCTYCGAVTRF